MSAESSNSGSTRPWLRWGVIPLVAVLALALVAGWYVWDRETLSADEIRAVADDAAEHLSEHRIDKITAGEAGERELRSLDESVRREVDREIVDQVEHAALRLDVPVPKITRYKHGDGVTISNVDGEDPVCLYVEINYSNDAPPDKAAEFLTFVDLTAKVKNVACG